MKMLSITRNNDYLKLYRKGKCAADSNVVIYLMPNKLGIIRLGLTTSKKIGNAVSRCRARRVMRAAFREIQPMFMQGYDIILVARTKTTIIKSTALTPILTAQFEKLGALQSNYKE